MLLHETVTLGWLQARRLRCEACARAFSVLVSGEVTGRAVHVARMPGLRRHDPARAHALAAVRAAATTGEKQVEARCPGCGRHQRRMREGALTESAVIAGWMAAALVAVGLLAVMGGAPALALGVPVTVVMAFAGASHAARVRGRERGVDPRARTDEQLDDLVLSALSQGRDPWTAWAEEARIALPRVVVSVGFVDEAGGGRFLLPVEGVEDALDRLDAPPIDLLATLPARRVEVQVEAAEDDADADAEAPRRPLGAPVILSPFRDARLLDVR